MAKSKKTTGAPKGAKSPQPAETPAPAQEKAKTELIRCPGDIAEMLKTIEQHRLKGWNTVPKILDDDDCPLKNWLRPLYEQVLQEKAERAARMEGG
ncbi:MAG TPA: hypothetical protein VGE74_18070 [Gemmata sp.]